MFVIGSMRCGSTLFRYLLNSHDRLSCGPESRFVEAFKDFIEHPYFVQSVMLSPHSKDAGCEIRNFLGALLGMQAKQDGKQMSWSE